ncbi:hypothetical protein GOODEAATRI_014574, partial [Goodea atripinnis]
GNMRPQQHFFLTSRICFCVFHQHPDRKEERCFVPYKPPPEDGSPAEVEEFLEHARFIAEDLEWLLALPHDKFWCQVVFDESLQRCLDSYLHHAPRGLDVATLPLSPAVADVQRAEHFFTPAVFGEIIYDNFLFDIPKILDLCVLFGKGNTQLLHKMIENIFTQQPAYYNDLDETLPTVLQVFHTILDKCGLQCEGATAMEPMKLTAQKQPTAMSMNLEELGDIVLYLCDSTTTIHAFLDIFPAACSSFHSHGFLGSRENKQTFAEELLQYFTSFLPEKSDETRTSYLLQGVESAWDSTGRRRPQGHIQNNGASSFSTNQGAAGGTAASSDSFGPQEVKESRGEVGDKPRGAEATMNDPQRGNNVSSLISYKCCMGAVCPVSGPELESLLSCIGDLLPDLGEGFLLACLQEYDYNSELVINNILEDRLAPDLEKLDRAMPRPVKEELPAVLNNRSNVFDDDEFDVFRRERVDMSRIWKGRRKGENTQEMLNDKQHIAEQRARYQAYETVVDEVVVEPGDPAGDAYDLDDYDDEYDDTYDMNQVGANDLDGDSLLNRRYNHVNRDHFVQDPALLRERAEAKRAAMQQKKG